MSQEREERIKQRAHQLWEAEGRPHGSHDEHWRRAAAEGGAGTPDPPAVAAGAASGTVATVTA